MASNEQWRDRLGRRLQDYPQPSVAVDTAVLTVVPPQEGYAERTLPPNRETADRGTLAVLVHRWRPQGPGESFADWALPGTFLHEGERLRDAVLRSLRAKCGLQGLEPRQLRVFDDPWRDPRGWVLSVAHFDVVPYERIASVLDNPDLRLRPIEGEGSPTVRDLVMDHQQIVEHAKLDLRAAYKEVPDPAGLIGPEFTLHQLRMLHEAVAGESLPKDTFRRRMERHLEALPKMSSGTLGRPAQVYRRLLSRSEQS